MTKSANWKNSEKSNFLIYVRVTTFMYKLDDMEVIEETFDKTQGRREHAYEDEQLLEDF